VESALVTVLGVFFSYFLSFVLGNFVATIFGCVFAFYAILSPEFKARQRNWELLAGRDLVDPWRMEYKGVSEDEEDKQGLYGSLFLGRVDDVCVVEDTSATKEFNLDDFQGYTMDSDELEQWAGSPYLLRVRLSDDGGRALQVHARMSEEYISIENGMPAAAIVLSTSQSFSSLAALTDVMVPDAECWIGDYPYLNRPELETLLAEDDELWDLLQSQGDENFDDYDDEEKPIEADDDDDDDMVGGQRNDQQNYEKVPIRRRRYY
jgi:hypothetical protein